MTDLELFVLRLVQTLRAKDPAGVHRPVTVRDVRVGLLPYRAHRNALRLSSSEDYDLLLLRLCAEEGGFVRTNPPEAAERCREQVGSPNPDLALVVGLDDVTIQIGAGALHRIERLESEAAPVSSAAEPVQGPLDASLLPLDAAQPPDPAPPMLEEPLVTPPEPGLATPPAAAPVERTPASPERGIASKAEPEARPRPDRTPRASGRTARPPANAGPRTSPGLPASASPPADGAGAACPHCREGLPRGRRVVFCPFCGERLGAVRCSRCGTELESRWRHCITCGQPVTSEGGAYA